MLKQLLQHPRVQALVVRILGFYLSFALRTTRWEVHGGSNLAPHVAGTPCIAAFWHERLPLSPEILLAWRQRGGARRMHVLVSRHRDGRLIGEVVSRFDVDLVHASSSRGGAAGLRALAAVLNAGEMVAITPDGPRGPRRRAAPGIALLAGLTGVPVLPCAAQAARRIVLNTWDRMAVPLPFSRGVIVFGPAIPVSREGWNEALPEIEAALNAVTEAADALCR